MWSAMRDPLYAGFKVVVKVPSAQNFSFPMSQYGAFLKAIRQYPVLVCFCTEKGLGRYWEAHLDSGRVCSVTDNADSERSTALAL